jgi:hypothetical protein
MKENNAGMNQTDLFHRGVDAASEPSPQPDGPIPFEAVPQLAANDRFILIMERLREIKTATESMEKEEKELKLEAGALAAVAGVKSVAFYDVVLTNVDGSMMKGKLAGAGLIEQLEVAFHGDAYEKQRALRAIALAANDCDPQALALNGFPAALIEPARSKGTPRAGSTQLSWAGGKGKGGKRRAAGSGSGGGVQ